MSLTFLKSIPTKVLAAQTGGTSAERRITRKPLQLAKAKDSKRGEPSNTSSSKPRQPLKADASITRVDDGMSNCPFKPSQAKNA